MGFLTGVTARILFSIPFLALGVRYLMHATQMGPSFPFPGGVIWAYLVGIIYVLGGLAAITKIMGKPIMFILAAVLIVFAFIQHLPGMMNEDAALKMAGTINFYKDLGLAGGALLIAGLIGSNKAQAA